MFTARRFPFLAITLLAFVPISALYLGASLTEKHEVAEELSIAMQTATSSPNSSGIFYEKQKALQALSAASIALEDAEQHKGQARRKYVKLREHRAEFTKNYSIDPTNSGAVLAMVEEQKEYTLPFVRYVRGQSFLVSADNSTVGVSLLRSLLVMSLGERTDIGIREGAVAKARERVFGIAQEAQQISTDLLSVQREYEKEIAEYQQAWNVYTEAKRAVDTAEARIAEVQRITNEVQAQITSLQRELARIDARLKAKLERELIEKGLMSAQPGERSDGRIRSTQVFRWPVVGRISAGFNNAAYREFFGVPHKAIDIAVPQGTAVSAAADGIVYLAHDGGRFGYSYVLVGHQNGYATLYGHLSTISVRSGEELSAGNSIGYSGGTPGTYGAGPMTTGAHLHFEVIKDGTHINPYTVLP